MAVMASVHGGYLPSKFPASPRPKPRNSRNLPANNLRPSLSSPPPPPPPPLHISTNLSDVNPIQLRDLYAACNHSCHRFPNLQPDGRVEPVDVRKLRTAVSNSSVVVSVFTKPDLVTPYSVSSERLNPGGDWIRRIMPLTPFNGELIGFGRAVSDVALTASVYDVMVIPSLQGRGIGRMILQRIIRMLTSKGIYDIAALCSEKEMDFFKACGFGDDTLGSTTMMYTRTGTTINNQIVKYAGRKLLLGPP